MYVSECESYVYHMHVTYTVKKDQKHTWGKKLPATILDIFSNCSGVIIMIIISHK